MWAGGNLDAHQPETGNAFKVAPVEGRYFEIEMERGRPDDEILERNDVTYCRLLTFDAAGKLSNIQRQRIDDEHLKNFNRKATPPCAMIIIPGSMNSMGEFNGGYGRDADFSLSAIGPYCPQNIRGRFTAALLFDEKAGVEDQAQQISPTPTDQPAFDCG